ncbi:MAG: serine--tRNA ligase, partial [Thermodesulfobacteriota bacterium]|nr:serine--tRNA ligase [Thermodesulfobacteriota bacterium]
MLDLKFVRGHLDQVRKMLKDRNMDVDASEFARLDETRRDLLAEVETLKHERNQANQRITELKKAKKDAGEVIGQVKSTSVRIKELDPLTNQAVQAIHDFLLRIPNIPHETVPVGRTEADNLEVKRWGDLPEFDFEPLNHWDIGENLDILDFPRAAKITGSRFVLLKGPASRMERALINYMLDLHTDKHGFTEVLPPFMTNAESMTGTGQLPKFADDLFKL